MCSAIAPRAGLLIWEFGLRSNHRALAKAGVQWLNPRRWTPAFAGAQSRGEMTMLRKSLETLWAFILAAVAVAGSLAAACMMPFVAIAVVAAATMGRGAAVTAVAGAWGANQILGFGLLGYPWTPYAAAFGLALGMGSLAALFIARSVGLGRDAIGLGRVAAAFGLGFIAYEALLFALALAIGGTETFAPRIVLQIAVNDGLWLAGLLGLYALLRRAAPGRFGSLPALRLA